MVFITTKKVPVPLAPVVITEPRKALKEPVIDRIIFKSYDGFDTWQDDVVELLGLVCSVQVCCLIKRITQT